MEELPVDLTCHILGLMTVPVRVKIAGLNNIMRRRIFQDCSEAWVKIDFFFGKRHGPAQRNMNDMDLLRLLTNGNAGGMTKELVLAHCHKIEGAGLAPLRDSRVLESIDLLGTNPDSNNPNSVL